MRRSLLALLALCLVALTLPARADPAAYRLGPGDALRVTVFGEDDLSGGFTVDGSGRVALPLVGEVRLGGLSLPEAEAAVTALLADGYLRSPRVSIEVANFRPFYILGEVRTPGSYPYAAGMTVMTAVALAGGFTYRADEDDVEITAAARPGEPAPPPRRVGKDDVVLPGDVVRIGERFF